MTTTLETLETLDALELPDIETTKPEPPKTKLLTGPYRVPTLGIVLVVTLLAFEAMAVGTVMPVVARDLNGLALYGWSFSSLLIASMLATVLAGGWIDRAGPTRPLLIGLATFVAGLVIAGSAAQMWMLVLGRTVQGLGSGVSLVAVYVVIARVYPEQLRPRVFAALATGGGCRGRARHRLRDRPAGPRARRRLGPARRHRRRRGDRLTPGGGPIMIDFALPPALEAHEPPESRGRTRDGVRLLVSRRTGVSHHEFRELPSLLRPGDLLVINTSATLPSAVRLDKLAVHFSTPLPEAPGVWLVELRRRTGKSSEPYGGGTPGEWIPLPGGATLTLIRKQTGRLWQARLSTEVVPYLRRHGLPIRYGYVRRDWPNAAYQTAFAWDRRDGSAEMPSAGRPFTPELVTRLVSQGVLIAPLTLHTGVASPEAHEPPYAERFDVPEPTADLVNHVRSRGGRVIAVGTTVVRALETAAGSDGLVRAASGWTEHIVTPEAGVRAVDGLLTGLHEPKSSHLMMLSAIAGPELLESTYEAALAEGYLWHEFGDLNLLLP